MTATTHPTGSDTRRGRAVQLVGAAAIVLAISLLILSLPAFARVQTVDTLPGPMPAPAPLIQPAS
jgi:hypothetical protein